MAHHSFQTAWTKRIHIVTLPQLADSLVFKGGTCLRKAYFPGYRFSEDLDFTSRSPWRCEDLLGALVQAADIRDQCAANEIPFFLKQLGGVIDKRGKEKAVLNGQLWGEMPVFSQMLF